MDTFLRELNTEKNINHNYLFEIHDEITGFNQVPLSVVFEFILDASSDIQDKMRNSLTQIDLYNGDIMNYYRYLAEGMVRGF